MKPIYDDQDRVHRLSRLPGVAIAVSGTVFRDVIAFFPSRQVWDLDFGQGEIFNVSASSGQRNTCLNVPTDGMTPSEWLAKHQGESLQWNRHSNADAATQKQSCLFFKLFECCFGRSFTLIVMILMYHALLQSVIAAKAVSWQGLVGISLGGLLLPPSSS